MIDWINTLLTSVSMSIDAMTVNATNGLKEKGMPIWKMLLISLSYGIFQFLMPCIGYFVGFSFKEQLEKYIPWIAFTLLGLLAVKSLIDWLKDFKKTEEEKIESKKIGFLEVLLQDVATAIDALCIGFVYLELSIGNALIVFFDYWHYNVCSFFFKCSFSKTNRKALGKMGRAYCRNCFSSRWFKNLARRYFVISQKNL